MVLEKRRTRTSRTLSISQRAHCETRQTALQRAARCTEVAHWQEVSIVDSAVGSGMNNDRRRVTKRNFRGGPAEVSAAGAYFFAIAYGKLPHKRHLEVAEP